MTPRDFWTCLAISGVLCFAGQTKAPSAEHDGLPARAAAIEVRAQEARTPSATTPAQAVAAELSEPAPQPSLVLPSEPVPVGELVDVSVLAAVPAGVTPTLNWKINGQPVDAKHVRLTADGLGAVIALPAGKHTITVRGGWAVIVNGQAPLTFIDLEGVIQVGNGPNPPPPGPVPPEPVPVPVPTGLGALVPDPAHRALLAEFYSDFAAEVRKGAGGTTGDFYAAQRKAVSQAQSAGLLPPSLAAINKPISDRITAALGGIADVPLDDAKRTALADALDSIAAEFK